jgi:hypothetical protein
MIVIIPKEGIPLKSKKTGKTFYYNPITDTKQYKPFNIQEIIYTSDNWDVFYLRDKTPWFKNRLTHETQFKMPVDSVLVPKLECELELTYPITESDLDIPTMDKGGTTKKSEYSYILNSKLPFSDKRKLFCDHKYSQIIDPPICDIQCHNLFLQQLYESFFVKYSLEDIKISYDTVLVYRKIFDSFDKKILLEEYKKWLEIGYPYFPVNQKNRNWTEYIKNDILMNMTGFA